MSQTPTEIVQALLKDPTNLNVVSQLVAPNATYVSLNFENEELLRHRVHVPDIHTFSPASFRYATSRY